MRIYANEKYKIKEYIAFFMCSHGILCLLLWWVLNMPLYLSTSSVGLSV